MSNRSIGVWLMVVGVAGSVASGAATGVNGVATGEAAEPLAFERVLEQYEAATYRLVSAQVVMSPQDPPILKLAANGPIAFASLSADEAGVAASPARIVARLYGVTPGDLGTPTSLAPFIVTVRQVDNDSMVTVEVASLPAGHALTLRAAPRTSELEVRFAAAS
jgi:hypothetical protein